MILFLSLILLVLSFNIADVDSFPCRVLFSADNVDLSKDPKTDNTSSRGLDWKELREEEYYLNWRDASYEVWYEYEEYPADTVYMYDYHLENGRRSEGKPGSDIVSGFWREQLEDKTNVVQDGNYNYYFYYYDYYDDYDPKSSDSTLGPTDNKTLSTLDRNWWENNASSWVTEYEYLYYAEKIVWKPEFNNSHDKQSSDFDTNRNAGQNVEKNGVSMDDDKKNDDDHDDDYDDDAVDDNKAHNNGSEINNKDDKVSRFNDGKPIPIARKSEEYYATFTTLRWEDRKNIRLAISNPCQEHIKACMGVKDYTGKDLKRILCEGNSVHQPCLNAKGSACGGSSVNNELFNMEKHYCSSGFVIANWSIAHSLVIWASIIYIF